MQIVYRTHKTKTSQKGKGGCKMNIIILLAIIGMFVHSFGSGIGIILGICLCWLIFGDIGRESIRYHLTNWSWWDIRV